MNKSQVEIVQNADRLAANLQAGPQVSKNALLSVVATFMSDPSADIARLRRTIALLEKGSGGHLKRGAGFGDQVRLVIREVGRLLDRGEWQPDELKSLFGWTARLLLVRQEPRAQKSEPRTPRLDRQGSRQGQLPRGRRPPAAGEQEKKPPARPFRATSAKNLEVLKTLGKKLPDPDKKDS